MKKFARRSFLKTLGAMPVLFSLGMAKSAHTEEDHGPPKKTESSWPKGARVLPDGTGSVGYPPGYLSIVQCATSDSETLINVFSPRLKRYNYEAVDAAGNALAPTKYETVTGPGFYKIDKLKITGMRVGVEYTLKVRDGRTVVDERFFGALDTQKSDPVFGLLSCMCDDYRFTRAIDPMWERLRFENPEFLILSGDSVYVDSFEFVERGRATEADLWQRYVDAFRRIPLYHWRKLVPVFAIWDDHDFGTNDGDREFVSKAEALRLFRAAFGGESLAGAWEAGPAGVASSLTLAGQRFFFMDDRMFRQPNKNQTQTEPFGHWGQDQHEWLMNALGSDARPAWLVNGNQFFNGKALDFKEVFEANHPAEFVSFVDDLRRIAAPVVFASGDIHLSEVMCIPLDRMGYETFEFTSSSMHSFTGDGWENPMRVPGAYTTEFNFMMVRSRATSGGLDIDVKCVGLAALPYFEQSYSVRPATAAQI